MGIKSTDERRRTDGRRPKSILGFCPAEFICLGHLTLSDFPLSPSLPPTPSCLPQSSPVVRRPSGVPGRRAPSRRNIKSISERRYLSSRNYRGIYGPVSFVNCTRWAGSRHRLAAPKRSSFFFLGRVGDIYLIKRRWRRRSRSESRPLFRRPARGPKNSFRVPPSPSRQRSLALSKKRSPRLCSARRR